MSVTKSFAKEYLVEELGLPWSCLESEIVSQGRWTTYHSGVAEIDGQFWRISWSEGSTEYQDESPWEYEETVTATLVEKREVLVEQWVEVDS